MGFSSQPTRWWIYFLSKCDFHGGSDKVPWTQLREPVWENVDRVDFRIHTFNLGIHLRNLEQLAFFRVSLRWSLCWTIGRWYWALILLSRCTVRRGNLLFQLCSNDRSLSTAFDIHHMARRQDMLAGMVLLLLMVILVRLTQLCTQFGRFGSC